MGTEGYVNRGSDPAGVLCELPRLFGGNSLYVPASDIWVFLASIGDLSFRRSFWS